ncbi:MAG TPA: pilus assembly PilX N-terminal domain-containing protein [Pyrinomonadaceae bacterium]|nr:pilus assembly PilX N-terminal domain-containing protein [Pyrinomonadaceae bacterium]
MDPIHSTHNSKMRKNERGAALITSLIIATVLLVGGGALIQITSMSAANSVDSTAETQAYYAAEAGLQAALNALRGNAAHTGSALPTGMTTINFRNAVIASSSNDCPNGTGGDPSTSARLSRWLPYSATQTASTRVTVGTNPTTQYEVVVSLPPGPDGIFGTADDDVMPVSPNEPSRLLIQSTGYGPNSSKKQMSMIVARAAFDPAVPAMMTLVGAPAGSPAMSFDSGNSAHHVYSGVDHAGLMGTLPAFGTTNTIDNTKATTEAAQNTTSSPASAIVTLPDFLQTPALTRNFLNIRQAQAMDGALHGTATYLPNGGSGNPTGFTFVNGDYTMGSGSGSGLLIVTGELTTNGSTDFNGLIYVLGTGAINRNGGGGGAFYGATFVATVDWPAQNPALANFGAPFFNFNGAGNATMQYDSAAVANALSLLPAPVLGVCEY